jgi:hypothetical protein
MRQRGIQIRPCPGRVLVVTQDRSFVRLDADRDPGWVRDLRVECGVGGVVWVVWTGAGDGHHVRVLAMVIANPRPVLVWASGRWRDRGVGGELLRFAAMDGTPSAWWGPSGDD